MHVLIDSLVMIALAVIALAVMLFTWRSWVVTSPLSPAAEDQLGLVLSAWAFAQECAAMSAAALLAVAGWVLDACAAGNGRRGPLLLVAGGDASRGALLGLRYRLLRGGWSPVCGWKDGSGMTGLDVSAEALRARVAQLAMATGSDAHIAIIGYGWGGLVVRRYVQRHRSPRVRRIVTLGTPHAGTALAALPFVAPLRPGSPFLQALNCGDTSARELDVIAIYSAFDALILPPHRAQYPGAFNVQIRHLGHYALLFSAKVFELIQENLIAPLPDAE